MSKALGKMSVGGTTMEIADGWELTINEITKDSNNTKIDLEFRGPKVEANLNVVIDTSTKPKVTRRVKKSVKKTKS